MGVSRSGTPRPPHRRKGFMVSPFSKGPSVRGVGSCRDRHMCGRYMRLPDKADTPRSTAAGPQPASLKGAPPPPSALASCHAACRQECGDQDMSESGRCHPASQQVLAAMGVGCRHPARQQVLEAMGVGCRHPARQQVLAAMGVGCRHPARQVRQQVLAAMGVGSRHPARQQVLAAMGVGCRHPARQQVLAAMGVGSRHPARQQVLAAMGRARGAVNVHISGRYRGSCVYRPASVQLLKQSAR
jgi:hypothetical protein